jgi:hypothetical protein
VRKSTSRRSPTRRRLRRSIPDEDRCCHRSDRGSRRTTSRSSGLQQPRARRRACRLRSDRRPRALEAFRGEGSGAFSARRGPVDRDPLTPLVRAIGAIREPFGARSASVHPGHGPPRARQC